MGACTKVYKLSNFENRGKLVFLNFQLNQLRFELIVLEQIEGLILRQIQPFESIILIDYLLDGFL